MSCFDKKINCSIATFALFLIFTLMGQTCWANAIERPLNLGDSLSIWVVGEPELSRDTFIGEDGKVLMPLVGYVTLAGLTPSRAKEAIESAYADGYLQKPIVHLAVRVQTQRVKQGTEEKDAVLELDSEEFPEIEVLDLNREPVPDEVAALFDKQAQIAPQIELRILDGHTKQPLSRAQVHLAGQKRPRRSNKMGFVTIPAKYNLYNETAIATITHKSYQPETIELSFVEPVLAKTFRLYPVGYEKPESSSQFKDVVGALNTAIDSEFLEARVSLDVENKDVKTILKTLLTQFDISLSIDDDEERFDLTAKDVTVRELLKHFLLSRGYQYTVNDTELVVVVPMGSERKTVKEMLFRDISLFEALRILAKLMKINIFVTPQVQDKVVNFYVDYLNLNDLLELLLETNGLKKHRRGLNTYIITTQN